MSDFVYDNTTLPTGKSDARVSTAPADKTVTAAEWNSVMQAITDLRAAVLSGQYHGLASDPVAPASGSGGVYLRSNAGVLEISQNGSTYMRPPRVSTASSIPVSGTWLTGDIVYNSTPVPGGTIGWVCTTGGTPGTWKVFGIISF